MTVTEREPLSRPRVAAAALALIDERGLEQLSMRKLGAELGGEAMSLYNHVANKDDLLRAVADLLYERILDDYGTPTGDWRAQARAMAGSYVSVAAAHPLNSRVAETAAANRNFMVESSSDIWSRFAIAARWIRRCTGSRGGVNRAAH